MEKWGSKDTPRLAKRKNSMEIGIYMIFDELSHAQKQFVELAGHFVVRGEVIFEKWYFFGCPKSPRKEISKLADI